ncbi:MAG TPA: hypothetical protein VKR52_04470 [Terracidiphilus sp.]|nr:hypothetical protein [Terracidiphilus sp.]
MAKPNIVYVIQEEGDKKYWHRAGVAFVNRDGSLNLKLDLFPNLQLQVREPKENEPR